MTGSSGICHYSSKDNPRTGEIFMVSDKIDRQLRGMAMDLGADYYGVADLSSVEDMVRDQSGELLSGYPRSISVGIALLHPIVDELPRRHEKAVALNYAHHGYGVINLRLDHIVSRLASQIQKSGYRAFPIAASQRTDDHRISGLFSHKLGAHMAGLGWIGKNCLLITPDMGPRVRWATVLTDADLSATGSPMEERCGDCTACADICPVRALKGRAFKAGEPRELRFDAGKCDRYFSKMAEKNKETAVCGMCLYACPYGRCTGEFFK